MCHRHSMAIWIFFLMTDKIMCFVEWVAGRGHVHGHGDDDSLLLS